MKRLTLVSLACAFALLVSVPTFADSWSTENGDFTTKFWKEMFKGGGPGQPGNTLMALGDGFIFKKGTLESTYFDDGLGRWITTYVDGELILNSSGPWLQRKKLKATGITATNSSSYDAGTGVLDFVLTFSGTFDNSPATNFSVKASYNGVPEFGIGENGIDFQRGHDFSAEVEIW